MHERTPAEWTALLADVSRSLGDALAAVDARAVACPGAPAEPASELRRRELAGLHAAHADLPARSGRAAEAVAEVDRLLQECEEQVRGKLAEAERVRRRLADWAGRAIG